MSRIQTIRDTEIPIWEAPELPEQAYVIMLAKQFSYEQGCDITRWFRLPLDKLNGTALNNPMATSVNGNGFNQEVHPGQVMPAYINLANPNDIRRANSSNPANFAKFLIVAKDPNNYGNYLVQSSGTVNFQEGHSYLVGQTYYLGEDGTATTLRNTDDTKVQELFYVLDRNTIDIRI